MSWYKVLGYPTGVGALLVRRDAMPRLRRPWWLALAGGGFQRKNIKTVDDYLDLIGLESGGAVRVSLGLASNFADVEAFLDFAERT